MTCIQTGSKGVKKSKLTLEQDLASLSWVDHGGRDCHLGFFWQVRGPSSSMSRGSHELCRDEHLQRDQWWRLRLTPAERRWPKIRILGLDRCWRSDVGQVVGTERVEVKDWWISDTFWFLSRQLYQVWTVAFLVLPFWLTQHLWRQCLVYWRSTETYLPNPEASLVWTSAQPVFSTWSFILAFEFWKRKFVN